MKDPVNVTVTGAAGQIGYAILFRIASGQMLGADQPINLKLLEITPALDALKGVVMEINDCAFPLVHDIIATDDADVAFEGVDHAVLVGARPRSAGMERKDLIEANAAIFSVQGKAINDHGHSRVKVVVVGNPANTNCLIAQRNAPNVAPEQFTALTRLDHNRAVSQLAEKTGHHTTDVKGMIIWGNHSATQYPDISHATVGGKSARELVDRDWVEKEFIPTVQQRGAAIIQARGSSSAASAANAAVEHMHDWALGTNSYTSMAVYSDGSYGVQKGLIYSYPCVCNEGKWSIVQGLAIDNFSKERMDATEKELIDEMEAVKHLLP